MLWTKYIAVRLGGSKPVAVMTMKYIYIYIRMYVCLSVCLYVCMYVCLHIYIYIYVHVYRWLPHDALQSCVLSVYNRLPRTAFSHVRSCTTNLYSNELIVYDIVNIYIYIYSSKDELDNACIKKQCSWMDYLCVLALIWDAKVIM